MPTAAPKVRALMNKWFGDPVDDAGPMSFLVAHGYEFDRGGMIRPPTPAHTVSPYEWWCVVFLCDEWDYSFEGSIYQIEEMKNDVK